MNERTFWRRRYNKKRRKSNNNTLIQTQQPKIDKINNNTDNNASLPAYENHAHFVNGPRNVGKTYYMLKILEKIGNNRPIHIILRSPNQYPNHKKSNKIKSIDKYKGSFVVFDDMIGARSCSQIDKFYTRGRQECFDVYYISQSCFGLPTQSIRNNSDIIILFKQTLGANQSLYYYFGA